MKTHTIWLPLLLFGLAGAASAQDRTVSSDLQLEASPCALGPGGCIPLAKYKHRLTFPARVLSYNEGASFATHQRGINWLNTGGIMSLTLRRPLDAPSTGNVRLTVVYEVYGGGDGDVVLHVTPIAFHHGSGFETYGSVASESLIAASGNLMQQSIEIPSGLGFSPGGDWWYFEINREGSFPDGLRVMAVAIDY